MASQGPIQLPHGYGPRALIPTTGFHPDPEAILRAGNRLRRVVTLESDHESGPESRAESRPESHPEGLFSFLDEHILASWILMGIHVFPYLSDSDEPSSFKEYQRTEPHPQTKCSHTTSLLHQPILSIRLRVQQTMSSTSSLPALPPRTSSETQSPSFRPILSLNRPSNGLSSYSSVTITQAEYPSTAEKFEFQAEHDDRGDGETISRIPSVGHSTETDTEETIAQDEEQDSNESGSDAGAGGPGQSSFAWDYSEDEVFPDITIRAPRSDEEYAQRYNETIKTPLLQYLDSSLSEFFVVLVIVECSGKDDIPAVLIIHDAEINEPLPDLTELQIQDTEHDHFVFLLVDGDTDMCAGEIDIPYNRIYQTHPVSGSSIEAKQCGTVGLFIEESDNKYVGVTCAHVAGSTAEQLDVLGPGLEDFSTYVAALREQKSECEKEIAESKNLITKYERTKLLDFVKSELQIVEPLAGTDEETANNIRLGKVRTSEYEVVNFRGRQCIADWAIVDIDASRHPLGGPVTVRSPRRGVLSTILWKKAESIGPLALDLKVRKTGAETGLTHGFVGGIYGGVKKMGKLCEEYWVIQAKERNNNCFADTGDSGSSVISSDGQIVGVVYAKRAISKIRIVCDRKTRVPDLLGIKETRGQELGEDVYSVVFLGERFILIESMEMVLERAGVGNKFVKDC